MEAINFLSQWVTWLLLIIPVGAGMMVTYYSLKKSLSTDMEEKGHCNARIKNTIKGSIIGMTVSGLITIIKSYYI